MSFAFGLLILMVECSKCSLIERSALERVIFFYLFWVFFEGVGEVGQNFVGGGAASQAPKILGGFHPRRTPTGALERQTPVVRVNPFSSISPSLSLF